MSRKMRRLGREDARREEELTQRKKREETMTGDVASEGRERPKGPMFM